jgi:hypothetical protein
MVRISVSSRKNCTLTDDGEAYCWVDHQEPAYRVALPHRAIDVGVGLSHSCALLEGGEIRCWGDPNAPEPVDLGAPALALAVGAHHACAIIEGDTVRCWGDQDDGRLGYPDLDPEIDVIPATQGDVLLGGAVKQISSMGDHTCVLLHSRSTRCWGANESGQLGLGHTMSVGDDEHPADVPVVDIVGAVERISAGATGQTCALLTDGRVQCWGGVQRWDGTSEEECWIEEPNPNAGLHGEPDTISMFDCGAQPWCCFGDDEPASAAPLVPL